MVVKRFAMTRLRSTGFIIAYVVVLPLLGVVALLHLAVFRNEAVADGAFGLPKWAPLAASLIVMALVTLRLWMHVRARKSASAASPSETEDRDD